MIKFDNRLLCEAVEKHEYPKTKLAFLAESSPQTLDRVLAGESDLNLLTLTKLADYFGLDVEVRFTKSKPESVAA